MANAKSPEVTVRPKSGDPNQSSPQGEGEQERVVVGGVGEGEGVVPVREGTRTNKQTTHRS